jgi:hypothetical protein
VFCASAGLDALGATSTTGPVGARGAGAIRSRCRRCARVARGRSSRLTLSTSRHVGRVAQRGALGKPVTSLHGARAKLNE